VAPLIVLLSDCSFPRISTMGTYPSAFRSRQCLAVDVVEADLDCGFD